MLTCRWASCSLEALASFSGDDGDTTTAASPFLFGEDGGVRLIRRSNRCDGHALATTSRSMWRAMGACVRMGRDDDDRPVQEREHLRASGFRGPVGGYFGGAPSDPHRRGEGATKGMSRNGSHASCMLVRHCGAGAGACVRAEHNRSRARPVREANHKHGAARERRLPSDGVASTSGCFSGIAVQSQG